MIYKGYDRYGGMHAVFVEDDAPEEAKRESQNKLTWIINEANDKYTYHVTLKDNKE